MLEHWTPEHLEECWVTTIEDGPYIVAMVWYHEVEHMAPGAWMIHCAAAADYRGRWVSLRVIGECLNLPFDQGATRLYAHVTSEYVGRIWGKLGFHTEQHPDEGTCAYMEREEWLSP